MAGTFRVRELRGAGQRAVGLVMRLDQATTSVLIRIAVERPARTTMAVSLRVGRQSASGHASGAGALQELIGIIAG